MLGFKHAFRGLYLMFSKERNFKIQFLLFILVIILGFFLQITPHDWILLLLVSALVLSLEIINSAIEKTCNLITEKTNSKIKNIKDISAAAVLLASIFALIIGVFIFFPYLKALFL